MGLFSRIKTILFEDDDVEEMPVYTSEDVKEPEPEPVIEPVVQEETVKVDDNSRFRNVKRDIYLNFDDDVLGEVPGAETIKEEVPEVPVQPAPAVEVKEEPQGFTLPSFDEDEFERINSRLMKHDEEVAPSREIKRDRIDIPFNQVKAANSNYSSTRDTREEVETGTIVNGKKPFTPSPVISPVYGILDKNYSKDDIKDKKGGLKREKVVKPIVKKEETTPAEVKEPAEEEHVEEKTSKINIDSVRKKAYGELENLEKTIEQATREFEEQEKKEQEKLEVPEEPVNVITEEERKETAEKVDKVVEEVIPEKVEKKEKVKPQILDDVEKTSTLQILDDIEKELNSIKPISKEEEEKENKEIKEKSLDDTLENDLFNLIDSMYDDKEE
jgi:hypothetical protein